MAKIADKYLLVDPWQIAEVGFAKDRAEVSESLFSLANEHQGIRGFFDEGYSGDSLVGAYINGIYEERFVAEAIAYKGISNRLCFMVNTVNWVFCRLTVDGETLDLAHSQFSNFRRELDFRSGELRREFVWHTASGKKLRIHFGRLLSMNRAELACQQIKITPLNFSGDVSITMGLDFTIQHQTFGKSFWVCERYAHDALLGVSENLGHRLFAGMVVQVEGEQTAVSTPNFTATNLSLDLAEGQETIIEKVVILYTNRDTTQPLDTVWENGRSLLQQVAHISYADLLAENQTYWANFWAKSDVTINGDPETQQGIRFCLFQMQQTFRGFVPGANIGAKGLTGEAYNGNAFWDTETYCLPFYLFSNPEAAKALIDFRYKTLPQALDRAQELDCEGACYPVATIDGTESCTLWQHASLQFQPTTAVAYAIEHYVNITGDTAFLQAEGGEMLVQICRFLASRGQWSANGQFGYYAVMGPDEFQMMVNNNAYTNYMAKRTFAFTLQALAGTDLAKWGCTASELAQWQEIAGNMFIPYDPETGLYEQHEGFFNLPHIDIHAIPITDFPLYHNWSYDRIYRNDMIKQPDVLMFMFLYNQSFSLAEKEANYDYYEPRCIHESSLSPSVHSIFASELGRHQEAFDFFRFATRIDLDNYNRNTAEGIHTTSIAAAWMNIVYGFGGMRSDSGTLTFQPSIPAHWDGYSFQVTYRGSHIRIEVTQKTAVLRVIEGGPVTVNVAGQAREINQDGISILI